MLGNVWIVFIGKKNNKNTNNYEDNNRIAIYGDNELLFDVLSTAIFDKLRLP